MNTPPSSRFKPAMGNAAVQMWSSVVNRMYTKRTNHMIAYPAGRGSMGDEAMLTATIATLRDKSIEPQMAPFYRGEAWEDQKIQISGAPQPRGGWDGLAYVSSLKSTKALYYLGADVLDAFYSARDTLFRLNTIALSARSGVKTTVLGFSFRGEVQNDVVRSFETLPPSVRLCCRDPISYDRLTSVITRQVCQVADVAFLLRPQVFSDQGKQAVQWIRAKRAEGKKVLGVNCNFQVLESEDISLAPTLVEAYASAVRSILREDPSVCVVYLAHDFRGDFSDEKLGHQIKMKCDGIADERCFTFLDKCHPSELKAVCAELDCAVSGRMHLAIACLGMGVPVSSFEYQMKFTGLYRLFSLEQLVHDGKDALDPEVTLKSMQGALNGSVKNGQKVKERLPEVLDLSRKNFADL